MFPVIRADVRLKFRFKVALENQPVFLLLDNPVLEWLGLALLAAGNVLVLSSMYRLGITGTYLGKCPFFIAIFLELSC